VNQNWLRPFVSIYMPDPDDFKSVLDEFEKAMMQSQGKNQVEPPLSPNMPVETKVQPPAKSDRSFDYRKRAEEDLPRIQSLRSKMQMAAKKHAVPVEYLEGIASRESRGGKVLNPETGYDDVKQAYGIMQIDERFHQRLGETPDAQEHIDQAAGILKDNKRHMDKKFPKWSQEERWRAAIAAYNMGVGNVKTKKHIDKGTTDNDYSQDVLIRSRIFKERLHIPTKKRR